PVSVPGTGRNDGYGFSASNGIVGVRFATLATCVISIGSASVVVAGSTGAGTTRSSVAIVASAVGAARISTTPITHNPIAAAAGNAAGSTKRAPSASPRAAPPKSEAHSTIDFHIGDNLRLHSIPSNVPPSAPGRAPRALVTTFTPRNFFGLRFPRVR